jgi:hypothetical protein
MMTMNKNEHNTISAHDTCFGITLIRYARGLKRENPLEPRKPQGGINHTDVYCT